jgi:hypothetical protein
MPCVGFEATIPVFELVKTFHALDRVATVIGHWHSGIISHCNELYLFIVNNKYIFSI